MHFQGTRKGPLDNADIELTVSELNEDAHTINTVSTSGRAGYTDGTYTNVSTTSSNGAGSGATFDLEISGGIITSATLNNAGLGYSVGELLSPDNNTVGTPSTAALQLY